MAGFRNSILGGINLIRKAIQSPNFTSGSTGWQINGRTARPSSTT
jgi:hypothetical protein